MWLRTLDHVPAEFFTSCHPNLPWFASMVFSHDTSPSNRFPTALQLLNAASTCTLSETLFNNTFLRTHAPFRSFTFLLNVGTESLKTNVRVCVCVVCPPLGKGFSTATSFTSFPQTFTRRGVVRKGLQFTTQRRHSSNRGDIRKGRLLDVPALNTLTPLVPLAAVLCFHGCSHATFPINRFSHSRFSAAVRRSSAAVASLQMRTNHLFKHLQLIGLLTLPLSHSFPWGTELTEYN